MPGAYTHIRIARAAQRAAHLAIRSRSAFEMGANGPDVMFVAHVLPKRAGYNLPQLASRLHKEQCGAFLLALLQTAKTPVQRSYALGFLMHYAADTVMHPYVHALCAQGGLFDRPSGHGFCEAALDTFFHTADTGKGAVPVDDAAPALQKRELAEVCALLRRALRMVYQVDVSALDLADTFHVFRAAHRFACSPHGGKKPIARAVDLALRRKGCTLCYLTPCRAPADGFPETWVRPDAEGESVSAGPHALCMQAVQSGLVYLKAANDLWQNTITPAQCWRILGSKSYDTGLPCATVTTPVAAPVSSAAVSVSSAPQPAPQTR
ncbi:MAG: zinc dependent phospholipase C family protein [Ruthenibacterium sp.]